MIRPKPHPYRLPERKAMTAIIGLHYLNGIVMLADTEEWLGPDAKSECDKLYRFICPTGVMVIGGSGSSHLIECANQDMHRYFIDQGAIPPDQILAKLNDFAGDFFNRVIAPLSLIHI